METIKARLINLEDRIEKEETNMIGIYILTVTDSDAAPFVASCSRLGITILSKTDRGDGFACFKLQTSVQSVFALGYSTCQLRDTPVNLPDYASL